MQQALKTLAVAALCLLSLQVQSQETFTNCTAAFLGEKMIVDQYSPTGKCEISQNAQGVLTVCTANLSDEGGTAVEKIKFKVAIRDGKSKTLIMFSDKTYREVPISSILSKCKKGDAIVLITLDDEYALPHNEMLVL